MRSIRNYNNRPLSQKILFCGYASAIVLFSACDSTRRVPEGQYLLTHNIIKYPITQSGKKKGLEKEITSVTKQEIANLEIPPKIDPQAVLAYVKQKPNTKILGKIPLHLFIYNLVNPEKAQEKKVERDQKIDAKNRKKIAEGKKALTDDQIKAKKQRRTFREWLMNAGEPPVILDSSLMNASLKQVGLFIQSKGYFNCKVRDSVSVRNKKAKVFYIIKHGIPYRIDSLKYKCDDSVMLAKIYADSANCLINRGNIYDQDDFLKERDRLTHYLNDNGYYAFSKLYIHYDIDSSIGNHFMNITIGISRFAKQDSLHPDSTIEIAHPVFHVRKVIVQMQFNPSNTLYVASDTLVVNDYIFTYPKGQMGFKPSRLLQKIFIKKGDLYRISNVDNTYTGLTQLKTFRYTSVKFVQAGNSNMLDCYIQLMPTVRQSIGVDAVGENTGGELGVQGDVIYENKNLFNGAEIFQFKLKGGLEAQTIVGSQPSSSNPGGLNNIDQLNTVDIGPEMDLIIPRPLFQFKRSADYDSTNGMHRRFLRLWPKANPQSVFKILYDYQDRPTEYERNIFGLAHTFNFDPFEKKDLKQWHIEFKFPEVNYVHATLFPAFQNDLEETNNFFLINSFNNLVIPDIGATVIFNNQVLTKLRNFDFFKISAEESGSLLYFGKITTIGGVPISHYLKEELDYRHYFVLSKDDKLVYRFYTGFGQPLAGVPQELPFDKSFWGGGANDLRGWEARSLGPGGYNGVNIIDQIGDIKLESNLEYRFNVIKLLGLALFVDAGNIWLLHPNPAVPNGNFVWTGPNSFYNQIAVNTGVGIRLDFTYFVFRFDFGVPIRDPARPPGEYWTMSEISLNRMVINLGIGYPF